METILDRIYTNLLLIDSNAKTMREMNGADAIWVTMKEQLTREQMFDLYNDLTINSIHSKIANTKKFGLRLSVYQSNSIIRIYQK